MALTKCTGSGGHQMLDWFPQADGYPGSVVCLGCSHGVLVVKGSVAAGVSQAGTEGLTGKVRVHYVDADHERMSYRKPRAE